MYTISKSCSQIEKLFFFFKNTHKHMQNPPETLWHLQMSQVRKKDDKSALQKLGAL